MFQPVDSPYLIPFDASTRVEDLAAHPGKAEVGKKEARERLEDCVEELADLQRSLYADNRHALLLVFQAMDAAGKDSTIRAVMSGINPAGFQVTSFKRPSARELDHDFLWRTTRALPERGRIGIFNRSHYEETLVVRVHPGILDGQRLPWRSPEEEFWQERFASIRDHERHLARNGTVVLKFWLNVSREEQARRLLARLDRPEKRWKFEAGDVRERRHWDAYMSAYEDVLNETSRAWAPWYAIPADDKPTMRLRVAEIFLATLRALDLKRPELDSGELENEPALRRELEEGLE